MKSYIRPSANNVLINLIYPNYHTASSNVKINLNTPQASFRLTGEGTLLADGAHGAYFDEVSLDRTRISGNTFYCTFLDEVSKPTTSQMRTSNTGNVYVLGYFDEASGILGTS